MGFKNNNKIYKVSMIVLIVSIVLTTFMFIGRESTRNKYNGVLNDRYQQIGNYDDKFSMVYWVGKSQIENYNSKIIFGAVIIVSSLIIAVISKPKGVYKKLYIVDWLKNLKIDKKAKFIIISVFTIMLTYPFVKGKVVDILREREKKAMMESYDEAVNISITGGNIDILKNWVDDNNIEYIDIRHEFNTAKIDLLLESDEISASEMKTLFEDMKELMYLYKEGNYDEQLRGFEVNWGTQTTNSYGPVIDNIKIRWNIKSEDVEKTMFGKMKSIENLGGEIYIQDEWKNIFNEWYETK